MWHDGTFYDGPSYPGLEIEDRVGGGDGFASGFAYGFLTGNSPQDCVNLGVAHGALLMSTVAIGAAVGPAQANANPVKVTVNA